MPCNDVSAFVAKFGLFYGRGREEEAAGGKATSFRIFIILLQRKAPPAPCLLRLLKKSLYIPFWQRRAEILYNISLPCAKRERGQRRQDLISPPLVTRSINHKEARSLPEEKRIGSDKKSLLAAGRVLPLS